MLCVVELLPEQNDIMELGVDLLLYHALITGVSMRTKTDNYIHVSALPVSDLLEGFGSYTTALSETTWEYIQPY